jgi:hypothetical protein
MSNGFDMVLLLVFGYICEAVGVALGYKLRMLHEKYLKEGAGK